MRKEIISLVRLETLKKSSKILVDKPKPIIRKEDTIIPMIAPMLSN